jgi:hypothetical protein
MTGPYRGWEGPRAIKPTALIRFDIFGSITDGDTEMPLPEPDDPSNPGDMLMWATIIVCCVAIAAVVVLALVIGLIVWLPYWISEKAGLRARKGRGKPWCGSWRTAVNGLRARSTGIPE